MVELNCKIKLYILELKRAECKWEELLESSFLLQDVMESRHSIDHKIHSTFWEERPGKCGSLKDKISSPPYCHYNFSSLAVVSKNQRKSVFNALCCNGNIIGSNCERWDFELFTNPKWSVWDLNSEFKFVSVDLTGV